MPLLTQALLLAAGATAILLIGLVPRVPVALFILGALFPIWSIASLPPAVFDAARYGLALLLVARLWALGRSRVRGHGSWAVPIALTGVLAALFTWYRGDLPIEGIVMLCAAILAWTVIAHTPNPLPVFLGFATTATLSAAVLIGDAAGIGVATLLTPNQDAGEARLTGLASSSIRVSMDLAIAIIVWLIVYRSRRWGRLLPLSGLAVCSVGILMCGGRTGIVGLALALLVGVIRGWIKPLPAFLIAGGATLALRQTLQATAPGRFNTLDRLLGPADDGFGGFTSGRITLLSDAWTKLTASPLTGTSDTQAHFAPLYFAALGGIAAGSLILWLTIRLLALQFVRLGDRSNQPEVAASILICAIFLVWALVEPYGPFFGFEFNLLLFACVRVLSRLDAPELLDSQSHGPHRTSPFVG